jgi:Yip1 domain
MSALTDRMIRAARLDVNLYEEVEADKNTMGQATTVVVLSSVAAGIGSFADGGVLGIIILTLGTLLGWYVWAYLTYFIGTRFLAEPQTKADLGELLRTIGFSSSPGLLRVLGVIPGLNQVVFLVAGIWMLVAMIIAVRQALDYTSTWRAIAVCVIGWTVQIVLLALLFMALGGPTPPD